MKASQPLTPNQQSKFYKGLFSEEAFTLVADQMWRINTKRGLASYDSYSLKPDGKDAANFNPFPWWPDETVVPHTLTTKPPHIYNHRVFEQQGDQWLNEELRIFGRNTGFERERQMCNLILEQSTPEYAGGTSRESVCKPISWGLIRKMIRKLDEQRAPKYREIPECGPELKRKGIVGRSCYVLISHPHLLCDLRELMDEMEIPIELGKFCPRDQGQIRDVIVLFSCALPRYWDGGALISETDKPMDSRNGARIDVYPVVIAGANAWASLPFRKCQYGYEPTFRRSWTGEKGIIEVDNCDFFAIQNSAWFTVLEVGVNRSDW